MSLVLLGCRVSGPAALSPPAARRAQRALDAFQSGRAAQIVACGGKRWRGVREADALCTYLTDAGVPEGALTRELWSHSTRQNARYAARLLFPLGIRRVSLVTCDWHMPRALRCFEGAGFAVEPLPAISPAASLKHLLWRAARERLSLELDRCVTCGFSRL